MTFSFIKKYYELLVTLALFLIVVVGGYLVSKVHKEAENSIKQAQIRGCERGNIIRKQGEINYRILYNLLTESIEVREVDGQNASTKEERIASNQAAKEYYKLRSELSFQAKTDCQKEY